MSKSKKKGTEFESALVNTLRTLLSDSEGTIHREVLHGHKDVGDITGLTIHGEPVVIEAKNYSNYSGHLKEWMEEARTEAGNADADYWFVAFKQVGLGLKSVGSTMRQPVLTDVRTLAMIAGHGIIQEKEESDE